MSYTQMVSPTDIPREMPIMRKYIAVVAKSGHIHQVIKLSIGANDSGWLFKAFLASTPHQAHTISNIKGSFENSVSIIVKALIRRALQCRQSKTLAAIYHGIGNMLPQRRPRNLILFGHLTHRPLTQLTIVLCHFGSGSI